MSRMTEAWQAIETLPKEDIIVLAVNMNRRNRRGEVQPIPVTYLTSVLRQEMEQERRGIITGHLVFGATHWAHVPPFPEAGRLALSAAQEGKNDG